MLPLIGFGRVECTAAIEQRVLDVLTNQAGLSSDPAREAVITDKHVMPLASQTLDGHRAMIILLRLFVLAFCQLDLH